MIGVVLWSSQDKEKAVIWCEDHAALAYLQGRENLETGNDWPEAGDLVELQYETVNELRHARSVSLMANGRRSELPGMLRGIGADGSQPKLRVVSNNSFVEKGPTPRNKVAAAG